MNLIFNGDQLAIFAIGVLTSFPKCPDHFLTMSLKKQDV